MFSGHGLKLGSGDVGPRQEIIDLAVWVAVDDLGEHVGQVAERLDAVQLAGLDQRSGDGPVLGAAVRAREEGVLAVEGNLGVIVPMLGRRSKSIIVGIRISDAGFAARTANNAPAVGSFISSSCQGMSLPLRPG